MGKKLRTHVKSVQAALPAYHSPLVPTPSILNRGQAHFDSEFSVLCKVLGCT